MVLRELLDKFSFLRTEKISFDKFRESFSNILYVVGTSLDSKVLDFLSRLDLDMVTQIIILTPYSNLDKSFTTSWKGLSRFIEDKNIKLRMKAPKEEIPSDIYFLCDNKIFYIPKMYFSKGIRECCICKNLDIKDRILNALATSEDFTTFKGMDIYHTKFNAILEIDKRNLGDTEKEKVLDALCAWENSGYDDIEPLWRVFEEKIRKFIQTRLKRDTPQNWFTSRVLSCFNNMPEVNDAILNRFNQNKERIGVQNIDDHPFPMEYLVAENYITVINNLGNRNLFSDYRSRGNTSRIKKEMINDIIKGRNPSIHARTPDSETDLYSNIILKMLISLEWLNELEPALLTMI